MPIKLRHDSLNPPVKLLFACALLFLLTLLPYATSFENQLTNWDDPYFVTDSRAIREFDIPRIFSETTLGNYYPITILTFAVDSKACGTNPFCFHVTSFLFHLLNVWLAFAFLLLMTRKNLTAAFVGAALFAVHPANVEAVSWIAARNQVVSTFFALLTLIAYWSRVNSSGRRRHVLAFASLALFIFAILSKSSAIAIIAILPAIDRLAGRHPLRALPEKIAFLIPAALITSATMASRVAEETPTPEIFGLSLSERVLVAGQSLLFYLSRSIFPRDLRAYYDFLDFRLDLIDYGIFVLVTVAVVYCISKSQSYERKLLFLGAALFTAGLLPVLKLIPFGEYSLVQDRYLYLPFLGISTMTAVALVNLQRLSQRAFAASLLIFALATAMMIPMTKDLARTWDGSERLWHHALKYEPDSAVPLNNLGRLYLETKNLDAARPLFEKALERRPGYALAHYNLGLIEQESGRPQEAESRFLRAVQLKPAYSEAHNNLGTLYSRQKDTLPLAKDHFEKAIKSGSDYPEPLFNLATVEALLGQRDEAFRHTASLLDRWPAYMPGYVLLGDLHMINKDRAKAIESYQAAASHEGPVQEIARKKLDQLRPSD